MSVSDPVADFLTGIRNAIRAKHRKVDVPSSLLKAEIAKLLLRERYINNYKLIQDQGHGLLRLYLKYDEKDLSVIRGLRRISSPGRRVYVNKGKLPRVMGGMGMSVVSSSSGVLSDKEARERGVGGELLCYIW